MAGRVFIIGHGTLGCHGMWLMCVVTNTTTKFKTSMCMYTKFSTGTAREEQLTAVTIDIHVTHDWLSITTCC